LEENIMPFLKSRIAIALVISAVSLGAAYAALQTFSDNSHESPAAPLLAELNDGFATRWKARTGVDISIRQAQNKSGTPIRAVHDGLGVATLALYYDRDKLREKNRFIAPVWDPFAPQPAPEAARPGSPFTSTIVFLVRRGNPKEVFDWDDLLRPGLSVVTPDPRRSESGRWNYLAAWGYAVRRPGSTERVALDFVRKLFNNVQSSAVADFIEGNVGDVLLVWESEAHRLVGRAGKSAADRFEIVTPSASVLVEPVISVVDAAANINGPRDVALAYIEYLYTPQAQDIVGRNYYRPTEALARAKYAGQFPPLELFTIDEVFGGWKQAEKSHFGEDGLLVQIQLN
jgi:sulfate/thiosulfate-binding protein